MIRHSTMPFMSSKELTHHTAQLMFQLSRILHQAMTQKMKNERLSLMQLHVMFFIHEHAGITMSELAKYLKITSPSASVFVNRLAKLGWIKRSQDKKNRKLVRLALTSEGQMIIQEKLSDKQQVVMSLLSLLSPDDQKELSRIFQHLLTSYNGTLS